MLTYLARRILVMVPTLIAISIITFIIIQLPPGDYLTTMINEMQSQGENVDQSKIEALRAQYGLDRPMYEQYFHWATGLLQGDYGYSFEYQLPVADVVGDRVFLTFVLNFATIIFIWVMAFPIGIYSAIRQDTLGDYVTRSFSLVMLAVPSFWVGTLVMVFPSVWWRWAPEIEYTPFLDDPVKNLSHMLVPAIVLGLSLSAVTMRMTRTMMLEVMRQDYVRTARAKGLSESVLVVRHALRNGLIPIVTLVGLQVPLLIGGAVIMEQIFVIPGMGTMLLEAVSQRDYPVVSGVFLVLGLGVLLINLTVDLSYGWLDPKVRQR